MLDVKAVAPGNAGPHVVVVGRQERSFRGLRMLVWAFGMASLHQKRRPWCPREVLKRGNGRGLCPTHEGKAHGGQDGGHVFEVHASKLGVLLHP